MSDRADPAPTDPVAIPAATLVVFRDAGGVPELLMVERAKAMAFAGGAMVFPGGRIDPGDHALAATLGGDPDDTAARVAAIRETIEEAGVAIGIIPAPDPATLAALRTALHGGTPLGAALAAIGSTLDLNALVPFARWRPAHAEVRVFDTRFYLARLPADAAPAQADATESVRIVWATAQAVLDAADAGAMRIIFPTRRNLERLAQFASHAEAVAHAVATPVQTITPWAETRDDTEYLCIPADAGYPVTFEPFAQAMRG